MEDVLKSEGRIHVGFEFGASTNHSRGRISEPRKHEDWVEWRDEAREMVVCRVSGIYFVRVYPWQVLRNLLRWLSKRVEWRWPHAAFRSLHPGSMLIAADQEHMARLMRQKKLDCWKPVPESSTSGDRHDLR